MHDLKFFTEICLSELTRLYRKGEISLDEFNSHSSLKIAFLKEAYKSLFIRNFDRNLKKIIDESDKIIHQIEDKVEE